MPLTRADKIQIDEYVKNGQIHNARRMLEDDGSTEARVVLEKLNKRYPPDSTPAPRLPSPVSPSPSSSPPVLVKPKPVEMPAELRLDEMGEIKMAIREKRYDDARTMLIVSDHPDADKMLARLAHIDGGSDKAKRSIYEGEGKDLTAKFQITFFLLIFLTVFGLIALGIFVPEAKKYPNAPGAGGILLLNRVVRYILYGLLTSVILLLALLAVSYALK